MSEYYFKRIRKTQWLGVRIPENLHLEVDADGKLRPAAPWSYLPVSPLPAGVESLWQIVLEADGDSVRPVLAAGTSAGAAPFEASRAALATLADAAKAAELGNAMDESLANPVLPLRLYQVYRDFPAQPAMENYASDDEMCLALITALGGSATNHPIVAYGALLFIVESSAGPQAPPAQVDGGDAGPARLRVTAQQSAAGVTLYFEHDGKRITNGSLFATPGGAGPFAPFYQSRRTLGVAQRASSDSGPVLIPSSVDTLRGAPPAGVAWAERPFRIADRLGIDQLAGELLNYEVRLFNHHGRCTHSGHVLLKRQRLDQPAPPLRVSAELVAPPDEGNLARCSIRFALAADQPEPEELEAVLYRQDYPVVATGFYGDDDDAALALARSLGSLGSTGAAFGQPAGDTDDSIAGLPNLSHHNLEPVPLADAAEAADTVDGQPGRRLDCTLALAPGMATRLFVAIRRRIAGTLEAPASQVVLVQHLAGSSPEALRAVPHFERFWAPLPAPAWLGEGAARVMEVQGDPAAPATVRVVVQHAAARSAPDAELIGGYRLWLRDVAAPGDPTPFNAVALVQAVPRLIKVYAPIEMGRRWAAAAPQEPRAEGITPGLLDAREFILRSAPAAAAATLAGAPGAEQAVASANRSDAVLKTVRALAASDGDAALVLAAMQALLGAGAAREVLLSVAKRRALEQAFEKPAGNWVFFKDQLGNLLGRAIQFWLPTDALAAAERPRALYWLSEQPGAQDTVALDDFGRVAWLWEGLADCWRHELEWLVEAVPRYAPIQGRRATLGPADRDTAMAERTAPHGQWHRLVVARREPFTARFCPAQVLDAPDDAFVIALDAPGAFRQSLYNRVARTRQGVLRMHPDRATLQFLYPTLYDGIDESCLSAWFGGKPGDPAERAPQMKFDTLATAAPGTWAELVYDEPPCMALTTRIGASADDVVSALPATIGPLRRPRIHRPATLPKLQVETVANDKQIDIGLARLDWFYSGASRPSVRQHIPSAALAPFADMALLRLPDPEAELLLYFKFDAAEPLRLVAHFRGHAFTGQPWDAPAGTDSPVGWGQVRSWLPVTPSISPGGDLRIVLKDAQSLPQQIVARWRCNGLALDPINWSK
ncbi:hypothetical protein [Massilia sp. S19_KUP03_FR1]|uniref:hypothetical protein n=1 Tax=Massilia sp. S19_KUP03_FR1 TaxID=3025503 RepID=UPI002FCDAB68